MADPGHDTIAAVATPPGRGALAVVRVSGTGSAGIAAALGVPLPVPRRAVVRCLVHPVSGDLLDRAVVTWFPAPDSYTGEDLLEISGHGGALVPALILDAVCAAGARSAERGEFTRRAYLNGKLDLLQAEAIGDLIDARSPRMGSAALFALERGLSKRVESLRAAAIELQALIAYDIDFPEEDDGPVPAGRIDGATAALLDELSGLLRSAPEGELLREGVLTVIAGRPNAGKSSLFNALLGVERAIVTEEAGTTRDAIEALVSVNGYPFRLVDTAGIRSAARRIESLGIEVARAYLERADLAIVCVEAGRAPAEEEETFLLGLRRRLGEERVLLVRTKSDLAEPLAAATSFEYRVVAPLGEGLPELREAMLRAGFAGLAHTDEQPLVTRRRHARALESARSAVEEFQKSRRTGSPPEIAVTHLQEAVVALEELLGVVTTEDVLDAVFSSFCVGK